MAAAQLVEYVAKSLADNPDGVSVEVEEDGDSIILRLLVDEEDMGRVIGRNGSIAKAMRSLLKVVSNRTGENYVLEIG
ncbi:MAG: KH domain-containing protein [Chloroflexi bacterium]|nr:KH domain-containing protein [Chloroflexota bacterium]MBJ7361007.1 KH domain-containing protein [Chloroflexota bacterium]MBJ7482437.1 KH domain-containing protein [Chloroflexota bacterium]MCX5978970.1 KH domain-containing protein [Chloroflexota bacterium]NQW56137.1 KH domain-containing protein [Chloroflexota bacterium]